MSLKCNNGCLPNGPFIDSSFGDQARDNLQQFMINNELASNVAIEKEGNKVKIKLIAKSGKSIGEGSFNVEDPTGKEFIIGSTASGNYSIVKPKSVLVVDAVPENLLGTITLEIPTDNTLYHTWGWVNTVGFTAAKALTLPFDATYPISLFVNGKYVKELNSAAAASFTVDANTPVYIQAEGMAVGKKWINVLINKDTSHRIDGERLYI